MEQVIRVSQDGNDVVIRIGKGADPVPIRKIDEDRRIAFGWASVAVSCDGKQIEDCQEHLIDPADLEDAAYDFNLHFHNDAYGENHEGEAKGRLVESFVVTPEKLEAMGLAKNALPLGWWIGMKIDDDGAWENVKKGIHKMFSIQGTAILEKVS